MSARAGCHALRNKWERMLLRGCLKDASKALKKGLSLLSFHLLSSQIPEFHVSQNPFLSKERCEGNAIRWFCVAFSWTGQSISVAEWFDAIISIAAVCSLCMSLSRIFIWTQTFLKISFSPLTVLTFGQPSLCHRLSFGWSVSLGLGGCLAVGWLQFWLSSTLSLGRS